MNTVYAVAKGKQPGIYTSWLTCKQHIQGYTRPVFRLHQGGHQKKKETDDMEVPVCVRVRVPVCVPVWLWGGVPVSFSSEVLHIILHLQGGTLYVHGRHPRVSILV